jgi:O-antigen/teichoic acid export membrane protein
MYFAHSVGASILGEYFLFLAYFSVLNLLSDGIGLAAVKRISEGKDKNEIFSASIFLRSILFIVIIFFIVVLKNYYQHITELNILYWLFLSLIVGLFTHSVYNGIYGSGKVGIRQISGLIQNFGRLFFQIIAVFMGFGTYGLFGGYIFGMLAGGLFGAKFLILKPKLFNLFHLKKLFYYAFWISLASSGNLIYNYADTIMIGYYLGNSNVGIYRVIFQFTSVATFTTTAMKTVLYPKISSWSSSNGYKFIGSALSKGFTYSLFLSVPVFVGGLVIGNQLLCIFYGESFANDKTTLYVLLAVQIVNVFMYLEIMCLNAIDKPKYTFKITSLTSILNILLNLILIPSFGIFGAAIATFITMTLNAIVSYFSLRKIVDLKINIISVRNILISSCCMGLLVYLYKLVIPLSNVWSALIPTAIGGVIYFVLLIKLDAEISFEVKNFFRQLNIEIPIIK